MLVLINIADIGNNRRNFGNNRFDNSGGGFKRAPSANSGKVL